MIWLEADERIEREEQFEEKKTRLEIQRNHIDAVLTVLADIRQIEMFQIPFSSDTEYKDFLYSLPSYKGDKKQAKEDLRWTVKQRKPGEIPEWKKKQLQDKPEPASKTG